MSQPNIDGAVFRKSLRSGQDGNCVEVAENLPHMVAVRDTKNRNGGILQFTPEAWSKFIDDVKNGHFDGIA
jgi:Domain of unknown function (DUF397)